MDLDLHSVQDSGPLLLPGAVESAPSRTQDDPRFQAM